VIPDPKNNIAKHYRFYLKKDGELTDDEYRTACHTEIIPKPKPCIITYEVKDNSDKIPVVISAGKMGVPEQVVNPGTPSRYVIPAVPDDPWKVKVLMKHKDLKDKCAKIKTRVGLFSGAWEPWDGIGDFCKDNLWEVSIYSGVQNSETQYDYYKFCADAPLSNSPPCPTCLHTDPMWWLNVYQGSLHCNGFYKFARAMGGNYGYHNLHWQLGNIAWFREVQPTYDNVHDTNPTDDFTKVVIDIDAWFEGSQGGYWIGTYLGFWNPSNQTWSNSDSRPLTVDRDSHMLYLDGSYYRLNSIELYTLVDEVFTVTNRTTIDIGLTYFFHNGMFLLVTYVHTMDFGLVEFGVDVTRQALCYLRIQDIDGNSCIVFLKTDEFTIYGLDYANTQNWQYGQYKAMEGNLARAIRYYNTNEPPVSFLDNQVAYQLSIGKTPAEISTLLYPRTGNGTLTINLADYNLTGSIQAIMLYVESYHNNDGTNLFSDHLYYPVNPALIRTIHYDCRYIDLK